MNTVTRYFTKQCTNCPSVNVCATFERATSKQLSPMCCCMCNCVWEEPIKTYVYHPESESVALVTNQKELEVSLYQGCIEVSEYFCTMVELGLYDEIDFEYEKQLRMEGDE
jgi:hypothetical protein